MQFKCPKCGSLNTKVTDYDTLDKNLTREQMAFLNAYKSCALEPSEWAKIIVAIITAVGEILKAIIDWMAKKNTQPKKEKKLYIACEDCHTISKLDEKTYEDAR